MVLGDMLDRVVVVCFLEYGRQLRGLAVHARHIVGMYRYRLLVRAELLMYERLYNNTIV